MRGIGVAIRGYFEEQCRYFFCINVLQANLVSINQLETIMIEQTKITRTHQHLDFNLFSRSPFMGLHGDALPEFCYRAE